MRPVVAILNPDKVVDSGEEFERYEEKFNPDEIDIIQFEGQDVGRLRVVRTAESMYIGGIQILPEFQRRGIGTSIVADLINESNLSGIPITLEVHDVNRKALEFYLKLGFIAGEKIHDQTVMRYIPIKN